MSRHRFLLCLSLAFAAASGARAVAAEVAITPEQSDFFEKKIRPLLVDRCIDCHAEDANGGLQLDSAAALRRGGAGGPVVVPGKPEESRLIHAVRGEKGLKAMPPDDPLSDGEIADLVKWIETGAADPRTNGGASSPLERLFEQAGDHWAFQPIASPQPPAVKAADLIRNPIDAFIQASLKAKGWSMSPRADARTLLRRAALDLTGVPPTVDEVEAFAGNPSPAAFESAVDTLLDSPRYGERWARHWLDVARYADSMGVGGGRETYYPYSWLYRDWCVKSLNDDMPFDRFVTAQLAADLVSVTDQDNHDLAALGFLTVGRRPTANVDDDAIDDRIDAITRGLLGLSVSCARCHDHKLEPIPTLDYYGLYGVLKSCVEPAVYPALKPQPASPDYEAFVAANTRAREEYLRFVASEARKAVVAQRHRVGDYLLATHDGKWHHALDNNGDVAKNILAPRDLDPAIYTTLVRGRRAWLEAHSVVFKPWIELSALTPNEFNVKGPALIKAYASNADGSLAEIVAEAFATKPVQSIADVAQLYNQLAQNLERKCGELVREHLDRLCKLRPDEDDMPIQRRGDGTVGLLDHAIQRVHEAEDSVLLTAGDPAAEWHKVLVSRDSPFVQAASAIVETHFKPQGLRGQRKQFTAAVQNLVEHPGAPIRLMAVAEGKPFDARVFVRGNPQSLGEPAPRQYLSVLRDPDTEPFPKDSSGRKELAKLIASPQNPLTARVIVNRVWAWHFGQGLVRTASDFGLQGEPPSHAELLDWLASRFIADGWSLKKLHRLIMQSHAYQQTSAAGSGEPPAGSARAMDPENRLLWGFSSRPLEFEAQRDSMLAVAGALDHAVGGKPFDVDDASIRRRSIYAKIDRRSVAAVMRAFNVPDSNFTSAGRSRTAVPAQALWLFNSPFAIESAKRMAAASRTAAGADAVPAGIVTALWRAALQRNPSASELADAQAFIAAYPEDEIVRPQADDWSYGFAEFDADTKTVTGFTPIDRFAGAVVRGPNTAEFDGTAMEMTPDGGKLVPGKAAVRRWTSPEKGTVKIDAELVHLMPADAKPADAPIVCRIMHSRHGRLGEWTASADGVMTKVDSVTCEPGDTIDFVALTDLDPARSDFIWSPTIVMVDRDMPSLPGMKMRWDARHDFLDPKAMPQPLGPWEELAQILLMSGEFRTLP